MRTKNNEIFLFYGLLVIINRKFTVEVKYVSKKFVSVYCIAFDR